MNITPSNGHLPENTLQSAYAKHTQVAAEITESERNKPQPVSTETSIEPKTSEKNSSDASSSSLPAEVPINVPVSAALARSLSEELAEFPDVDHAKVAALMEAFNNNKLVVDSDELADAMLNFYRSGR